MNTNFKLSDTTILSKSEMKSVKGGYNLTGTCGFITNDGFVYYGVSKELALEYSANGGRWCCDSCGKSTWLEDYLVG